MLVINGISYYSKKMMKKMSKGGMAKMMRAMKGANTKVHHANFSAPPGSARRQQSIGSQA